MLRAASLLCMTLLVASPTWAAIPQNLVIPHEPVSDPEEDAGVSVDLDIPGPCQNVAARLIFRGSKLLADSVLSSSPFSLPPPDKEMTRLSKELAGCLSEHPIEVLHTSPN
jgi:hypothetical protein